MNELVEEFEAHGIHLWSEGGQLRFRAPQGALTEERRRILSSNKEALLSYLDVDNAVIIPDPTKRYEPYPLTPMQAAYQLGRYRAFDYGGVPCTAYTEISYEGDVSDGIEAAWNELVERHEALRSVVGDEGHQRVLEHVERYRIAVADARGLGSEGIEDAAAAVRARMVSAPRDSSTWPLFELAATVSDHATILHLFIELTIVDAMSVQILLGEIERSLSGTLGDPPAVSFRDYVVAERSLRGGHRFHRDRSYWAACIDSLPPAPDLPIFEDPSRAAGFYRLSRPLSPAAWKGLALRSKGYGLTVSVAVLAAYAETVGRWSRRRQFTLNVPVFNRMPLHEDIGRTVGDFTSVSLLGIDLDAVGESFADRAAAIGGRLYDDLEHRLFSGLDVIAELGRRQGESPLFPVVFTSTIDSAPNAIGSRGVFRRGLTQTPQVWIDCQVMANGSGGLLTWDVREGVLPSGMAEAAFGSFTDLVERLSTEDDTWSERFPLRLPESQALQHASANDTSSPFRARTLFGPVIEQSKAHPDRLAVVDARGASTYWQVVSRAKAVAHALLRLGCKRGERVSIFMEKGSDQVAAVLGSGLAGVAYVPLDPSQPAERRNRILDDAGTCLVLTQSWLGFEREAPIGTQVINVDELSETSEELPADCGAAPDDPAYVIYTSGSTGDPKGVVVRHRAAANTVQDVSSRFGVGEGDLVLSVASLGFDLSVYDVFGMLSSGGAIVLPDPRRGADPSHWAELVDRHGVTVWNSVPSQMQMLQDYADAAEGAHRFDTLRLVMLSGDWIPLKLPSRIKKNLPRAEVISLGGATEASIWSIFHPVGDVRPEWASIPYGRPLANQYFRILDEALQDRPDMVPGELCIGGAGLADGYLGDARKTSERFIVHPLDGDRLYRTGDFGKYWPDGTIEFLGRQDGQVKIRGHRVELGEIEATLRSHEAVSDAVAIVLREGESDGIVGFAELAQLPCARCGESGVMEAAMRECAKIESQIDAGSFRALMRGMDEVAVHAMVSLLRSSGLFATVEDRATRAQISAAVGAGAHRERLLLRWLDALEAAGALVREAAADEYRCTVERVDLDGEWSRVRALGDGQGYGSELLDFMGTCLFRLGELLRGDSDVREVLFPEGAFGAARAVYTDNVVGRAVNAIAAQAIRRIGEEYDSLHPGKPFRIVEVGAGIAGTTMDVVEAVRDMVPDYRFTDVSDFFLSEARKTFGDCPWMSFGIFDINGSIAEQGSAPNSADAVLCANVLHNSRDVSSVLRSLGKLLAPGGWLVFIEPVRRHNYSQLVSMEFEFTDEDFADERAATGQSFLTREQWRTLLEAAGADEVHCIPDRSSLLSLAGQGVFLARFKSRAAFATPEDVLVHAGARLPGYMVPRELLLVDSLPHTSNGKIDRASLDALRPRRDGSGRVDAAASGAGFTDELESRIALIWAELLGSPVAGRDQDFYSLGGDSLLISRMVGKVREEVPEASGCEWAVLLRQMLQDPTVQGLAGFLRKSATRLSVPDRRKKDSHILVLGSGSAEPTCVLAHAGTGTLQPYQALIRDLRSRGGRDLVGVEVRDMEEYLELPPEVAISALAGRYTRELMERRESFVVTGYCIGGFLAAEVSRLLVEAGADVRRLIVISSTQPPVVEDELMVEYLFARSMGADLPRLGLPPDSEGLARAVRHILSESAGIIPEGSLAGLDGDCGDYGTAFRAYAQSDRDDRLDGIRCASGAGVYNSGCYSEEEFSRLFRVFRQSLLAAAYYRPEPYAGSTVFLRNTGSSTLLPGGSADAVGCWAGICVGSLEVRDLPGDHFRCMASANARLMCDLIEEACE